MIKYVLRDPQRTGTFQYIKAINGWAYASLKESATLFDTEEQARTVSAHLGLEVEPVDAVEKENNMGYIVQLGNTNRFVALVNGERMRVLESQATVFPFKEAALRACTDPDDLPIAVRSHNFRPSASRWVVYNGTHNAFLGPATCHYYTDQIDEATWFTTEAEAQSRCLVGEVVKRVSINMV